VFFGFTFLGVIFWDMFLPRIGLRRLSRSTRVRRMKTAAQEFRKLAVEMGGVLIKVGQFLSARLDILPREITDELSGLQDEVAAAPFEPIRELLEAELGTPITQKFSQYNPVPLASASIGQVYSARLIGCSEDAPCPAVVVKVQRPQIEEIVKVDLAALTIVGGWLEKYPAISKHASVPRLLEEFSRSLYEEIDYMHEGNNAEIFAEYFKDDPHVRVPQVIWSHTTRRVLTLEDVCGIKITDYAAIEAAGINRHEVAERLVDTYLQQVFEDAFFHADPHPGNLFVQPAAADEGPSDWKLTFIDFGMTGTLPENSFNALREMVMAIGTQDSHRLVESYQMLDVLLPGVDLELLERANRHVFERFWGKTTSEMMQMHPEEATKFLTEFGDLIYEMPFQLPENLILLGRCVAILNGMCTGLDPKFNVWNSLAPYAEKLVEEEGGGKFQIFLDEFLGMLQKLLTLPAKTDAILTRMDQGRLEIRTPALTHEIERLNRSQRKTSTAIVFAALLLGAVQLYIANLLPPAIILGAGSVVALFWLLFSR
jgi:predicted unusual protein kinase regulating ubiquinone biosynthesis (AarF/ABC1/UbiB family)